jgi:2,3-bisphosphoglycerate-dependent phosphoglycerate mutase
VSDTTQRPFAAPEGATEVIVVRHGASAIGAPGVVLAFQDGHADPSLSDGGRAQAERVADRLAGEPVTRVFVTGLARTVQTAAPLAARLGLEPVTIPELREVRLGDWEGGELGIRMAARDPLALRLLAEERWDVIPGAEPMASVAARVRAGLERVVAETGPGLAVAVLHGGIIGELCRQVTGSRPFAFIHADNGSVTRIVRIGEGLTMLRSFNDRAHLD